MAVIPKRASLLTALDTPRNQDPSGVGNRLCGYFGTRKVLEAMMDRDPAWAGKRLSISFLRRIGLMVQGLPPGERGVNPAQMAQALDLYGAVLESDYNDNGDAYQTVPDEAFKAALQPIRMVRMPYLEDDETGLLSVRYWIARGFPLLGVVQIHEGMRQTSGPTSMHAWNSAGLPLDEHITCFVGYDETHVIAADSAYGLYGDDRGLVGFTNDKFLQGPQRCVTSLWLIAQGPATPKPVEGFMPDLAKPTLAEMGPIVVLKRAELKAAEEVATQQFRAEWSERLFRHHKPTDAGWQWLIDAMVAENASARIGDVIAGQAEGWLVGMAQTLGLDVSKLRKVD